MLNCCGYQPERNMSAKGRKKGLCDLSNVVALGHNEMWWPKAAKVTIKLLLLHGLGQKWCVVTQVRAQRCQSSAATFDLSIVVAFGHNEL